MRFIDLLERQDVAEHCVIRSTRVGFMAYHGGELEKVTDVIAAAAAAQGGASYYGVTQADETDVVHVPSTSVDPAVSATLAGFVERVDAVITIHGFGRKRLWHSLLLGGRNRALAAHTATHLRSRLPDYDIVDDLGAVPAKLAGQHPKNPVNLPRHDGVQIELPPTVRWNRAGRHWSDDGPHGRAPQTQALIEALAVAAASW